MDRFSPTGRTVLQPDSPWVLKMFTWPSHCKPPNGREGVPALPPIRDILSNTLSQWIDRAIWLRMLRKSSVPRHAIEVWRLSQGDGPAFFSDPGIATEAAMMIPDARTYKSTKKLKTLGRHYRRRRGPADIDTQSAQLHSDIFQSRVQRTAGNGYMIQHTATDRVMSTIRKSLTSWNSHYSRISQIDAHRMQFLRSLAMISWFASRNNGSCVVVRIPSRRLDLDEDNTVIAYGALVALCRISLPFDYYQCRSPVTVQE